MKLKSLAWSLVLGLVPTTVMAQTDIRTYWWKGGLGSDGQDREGNFASLNPKDAGACPTVSDGDDVRSLVSRFYGIPTQEADGRPITRYDQTIRRVTKAITDIHEALADSENHGFGTDTNVTVSLVTMKPNEPLPADARIFMPSPQAINDLLAGEAGADEVVARELTRIDNLNALAGTGRTLPFATGPLGLDYPADDVDKLARPVTLLGVTMARALNADGTAPPPHDTAEEALAIASQTGLTRRGANSAVLYDFLVERWSQQLGASGPAESVEMGRSAGRMGFDM